MLKYLLLSILPYPASAETAFSDPNFRPKIKNQLSVNSAKLRWQCVLIELILEFAFQNMMSF